MFVEGGVVKAAAKLLTLSGEEKIGKEVRQKIKKNKKNDD